jgi:hypothetical protein
MNSTIPEIGLPQIESILKFLPIFETPGYQFGHWSITSNGISPSFNFNHEVTEFIRTLYKHDFIVRFDWSNLHREVFLYQTGMAAIQNADLITLRKLLTAHIRADRLVEGHLAKLFESGYMTAILRRFKQLYDQMLANN